MNSNPIESLRVTPEVTPNPNTLKFNINRTLLQSGSLNFPDKEKTRGSALEKLFEIPDVIGVMVGADFITVTKLPSAGWQTMAEPLTKAVYSLFEKEPMLFSRKPTPAEATPVSAGGEIERKIREVLDSEIRPAVAMDGGDITFYGYENGVVTLHLQGSCSSCPSSIMTLKMGVENRLKMLIPEVREVIQV